MNFARKISVKVSYFAAFVVEFDIWGENKWSEACSNQFVAKVFKLSYVVVDLMGLGVSYYPW
jgi:hypothetical protein